MLQSALYLAEVFKKPNGKNITDLNVSKTRMESKSGAYIGEALQQNPTYPIERLWFKDICLQKEGVFAVMEAANLNKNIQKLHMGTLRDCDLLILG